MGDEGNFTGGRHRRLEEGGVERQVSVHQADAVRPDQAHAIGAGQFDALNFEGSALWTGFTETAGGDDGGADATLAAFFERPRHERRRHQQHCQVNRVRHVQDAGVNWRAQQTLALGVDKMHRPLVSALHQVARQAVAQLGWVA